MEFATKVKMNLYIYRSPKINFCVHNRNSLCVLQSHSKCTNGTTSTVCLSVRSHTWAAIKSQTILTVHCCHRTRFQLVWHKSSCDCSDTAPGTWGISFCSSCHSQRVSDADSRIQMLDCTEWWTGKDLNRSSQGITGMTFTRRNWGKP
jgi:hypothetical protein